MDSSIALDSKSSTVRADRAVRPAFEPRDRVVHGAALEGGDGHLGHVLAALGRQGSAVTPTAEPRTIAALASDQWYVWS
jgi:hypothetical protein